MRSSQKAHGDSLRITKIVRGVVEVESFQRIQTTWQVEAKPTQVARRVLVRQPRASAAYNLVNPPSDTEVLPDAYYIPVRLAAQLSATARAALQPILDLRQAIGRIDSELAGWKTQQSELDRRAEQERQNLWAIHKDPNAGRSERNSRNGWLSSEAKRPRWGGRSSKSPVAAWSSSWRSRTSCAT